MGLRELAEKGDYEALQESLNKYGPYSQPDIKWALAGAITHGKLDSVRILLPFLNTIDEPLIHSRNGLHIAADCLEEEIIRFLIDQGADINYQDKYGQTALHVAIDSEIEAFIAGYNSGDAQPSVTITKLLLGAGADANIKTTSGKTPLDWANRGHPAAQVLLKTKLNN